VESPGFTAVATLILAIAIGANTAIFRFVDGVFLKPLPYPNADRIVRVMEKPPQDERNGISTLNFLDWQRENDLFDFHATQSGGAVTMTGGTEPVQLRGGRVSADFFRIFGIDAVLGRTFAPGGTARPAERRGAQPRVVGQSVRGGSIGGEPDHRPRQSAAYGDRRASQGQRVRSRVQSNLAAARVRTVQHDARFSLARFVRASEGRYFDRARTDGHGRNRRLHREGLPRLEQGLLAALGVYGVISYSVVQRTRELGIRAALGASKGSLLRLALDRGVLLTGLGLALGLVGAIALTRLMTALLFGIGPRDPITMIAVAVVLGVMAMMASYVPSRRATRVDPIVALRYE
jgi:hypothetical protein